MKLARLEVLSRDEISTINDASMEILEKTGIKVQSTKAVNILEDHGASVDKKHEMVYLPRDLVLSALKTVPSRFQLHGPLGDFKVEISTRSQVFATQGSPSKIHDSLNPRIPRDATMEDLKHLIQIVESLPRISIPQMDIWPNDVPYPIMHCLALKEWARYTRKPFGIGCRGRQFSKDLMEIASILAGGRNQLKEKPRLIAFYNTLSPLALPGTLTDGLIEFVEHGQPAIIAPAATAGTTAPMTLAGVLAQTNAEVLATITLTQMISKGTPVVYGAVNSPMDPVSGNVSWGSIETSLLTVAAAQLARNHGIPSRAPGCITDAMQFGMQNGIERFTSLAFSTSAGINYITCGGTYEAGLASSLELLVLDDELIGMANRATRGIEVTANTLAIEQIHDACQPNADRTFLKSRHTLGNLRKELFIPRLFTRGSRETWKESGYPTLIDLARKKMSQLLDNAKPVLHDESIMKEIDACIDVAKRRNTNEYRRK